VRLSRQSFIFFAAGFVTLLGLLLLAGWTFNVPVLTRIFPDQQMSKANTVLALTTLGEHVTGADLRTDGWLLRGDEAGRSLPGPHGGPDRSGFGFDRRCAGPGRLRSTLGRGQQGHAHVV
jgi:hypothetical protein